MNNEPYREFDVRKFTDYKQEINRNKGVANIWADKKIRHREEYMKARVEKLKQLYEQCEPECVYRWELPEGETDGRKAYKVETIIGDDISPFDLPNFEELMPKEIDYVERYIE